MPNTFTLQVATGLGIQPVASAYVSPIQLSVSSGLGLSAKATAQWVRTIQLVVQANLGLQPAVGNFSHNVTHFVTVSSGLGLQPVVLLQAARVYSLTVSSGLGLQPTTGILRNQVFGLTVSTKLNVQPAIGAFSYNATHFLTVSTGLGLQATALKNIIKLLRVSSTLGVSAATTANATHVFTVSSGLGLQVTAKAPRTITLTVSSGLGLQPAANPTGSLAGFTLTVGLGLHPSVTLVKGGLLVTTSLNLQATVTCEAIVTSGVGIPGLTNTGGPQIHLWDNISGSYPLTFAETPSGVVLMANGVDPMLRWDGLSGVADVAGVQPPTVGPTINGTGYGTITGLRYAFARFIDAHGNPSNPSPLAGPLDCGRDQNIDNITLDPISGVVTIEAKAHGLVKGQTVLIQGVGGLPINSLFTVLVAATDPDHFKLLSNVPFGINQVLTQGTWTGGGSFCTGVASITYSNLPAPTQSKAVRLQLLRNLEGNADVFYVDFDITLPAQTSYTSTLSDEQLAQQDPVVLRTTEGMPFAFRYGVPPSNRPIICAYLGRIFAAGDVTYYAGCVAVANGSTIVQGIGTQWTSNMAGRQIYIRASNVPYGVSSIGTALQSMVLTAPYAGPSAPYVTYLIRSSPPDRKVVQWSEPDKPEAWPPWNAIAIPEDNDEITALFVKGTYLYVVERRHIWRYQFTDDPAGGHAFLQVDNRGAINHRCIVQADDTAFLLDESGIFSYDGGGGTEPISDPIQTIFQSDGLSLTLQLDWTADTTLWHASLDPIRTIIRWFVTMQGEKPLTNAICYNYRLKRWWLESYPIAITSSATGTLAEAPNAGSSSGYRRAISGAEARMVLVLGEGALDLVQDTGTLRGTVSNATAVSISDGQASFAPALGGGTITIVAGTGAGQQRIISSNTTTQITVVQGWTVIPDSTSTYQIGGISWEWRSGWLDLEDNESDTTRDFIVTFEPMQNSVQLVTQFYYDHSRTPEMAAFDRSLDGVSVIAGNPEVTFELSSQNVLPGWRVWRQAQHSERYSYTSRFVMIDLSGVQNDQSVRVYQVSIRGVDQEGL